MKRPSPQRLQRRQRPADNQISSNWSINLGTFEVEYLVIFFYILPPRGRYSIYFRSLFCCEDRAVAGSAADVCNFVLR
jgi:hypothetical protein